jgi:hypothetical protein
MREDAADQYLSYKLIESNQDWKAKWFYICNHHPELPKPSGKQLKHRPWWNTKQQCIDEDSSRMPGGEVDDDDIVERLGKIFKDMPPYTPFPVRKYSTSHPPNKVSSRDFYP